MELKEKRPRGRPRKNPLLLVEIPKRPRGRPRKNLSVQVFVNAKAPQKIVKDYCLLTPEDLEMWVESTGRTIFIDALKNYKKFTKAKINAEIRWHTNRIAVVVK